MTTLPGQERVKELRGKIQDQVITPTDYCLSGQDYDDLLSALDALPGLQAEVADQKKALDLCGYVIEPLKKERDELKAELEAARPLLEAAREPDPAKRFIEDLVSGGWKYKEWYESRAALALRKEKGK